MVDLSEEFITAVYLGLKKTGMAVLWSLKKGNIPEFNANMFVRPWLPQARLLSLPAVRAVITHCGWNGILDCVYAQKPMLMVPEFNDQPGNC
jgi:UDP:flavonoid glycosyltransferase YjiC (YdhE family)